MYSSRSSLFVSLSPSAPHTTHFYSIKHGAITTTSLFSQKQVVQAPCQYLPKNPLCSSTSRMTLDIIFVKTLNFHCHLHPHDMQPSPGSIGPLSFYTSYSPSPSLPPHTLHPFFSLLLLLLLLLFFLPQEPVCVKTRTSVSRQVSRSANHQIPLIGWWWAIFFENSFFSLNVA